MKRFKFRSVVSLANAKLSVKSAAIILACSTLASAILGIVRDRFLNSYYLSTYPAGVDAYTTAFIIPDFMFMILTSGALAVSFIPVFNQRLASGNKKSAWELSSSVINSMALLTLIASVLIIIFADPLIRYVAGPGLTEEGMALAINMTRVIAINPFLMSIATVISSIQQAVGRFVFYALAPAVYNIGIIIGIFCFTDGITIFGQQIFEGGIMGVAIGVVFGAILQLIISVIGLFGLGADYEFKIHWHNQGFRSVLKLLPARSLDQGIDYANTIVNNNIATRLGEGVSRSFQQASSLHQMPVNLIGVAISTAFFPKMTEDLATGNKKEFCNSLRTALRTIIWISLPIAIIAYFARGYVVAVIMNGGDQLIASVLGTLVLAIFARSVFHIITRGFYAFQDAKTPFIVSIVAVGLTILLSVLSFNFGFGAEGLGWAQSIGAIVEIIILIIILQGRLNNELLNKEFWRDFFKICFAALITACVSYSMVKFFPLMQTDQSILAAIPKFCLISVVGLSSFVIASIFLNLPEAGPFVKFIKKILFRNLK